MSYDSHEQPDAPSDREYDAKDSNPLGPPKGRPFRRVKLINILIAFLLLTAALAMALSACWLVYMATLPLLNRLRLHHGKELSSKLTACSHKHTPTGHLHQKTGYNHAPEHAANQAVWQRDRDQLHAELQRALGADPRRISVAQQQAAVVHSFQWGWNQYTDCAWGYDELDPVGCTGSNWFHLGLTIVDSLDTMLLMGLQDEYNQAVAWIEKHLDLTEDHNPARNVNLFETTIRVLGGLLAAYHLSPSDKVLLQKAEQLGERLVPAFASRTGIPYSDVDLYTGCAAGPAWGSGASSVSEATTLCLEFVQLAHATGRSEDFARPAHGALAALAARRPPHGLMPKFVDPDTGDFSSHRVTLGARGDSYYEYLLKVWVQSGRRDALHLELYRAALEGIRSQLFYRTKRSRLLYVVEKQGNRAYPKMDHLVCFLPGAMALGVLHGAHSTSHGQTVLQEAEELLHTCYEMYRRSPTGLAPEITHFLTGEPHLAQSDGTKLETVKADPSAGWNDGEMFFKTSDAHCLLRPETVESLFIMWRVTKNPKYRQWGWSIWCAIQRHTSLDLGGYASIKSVLNQDVKFQNKMESFFLAETLKYLYLLFDDNPEVVPLEQVVFNTEAHPLPILTSAPLPHLQAPPQGAWKLILKAKVAGRKAINYFIA